MSIIDQITPTYELLKSWNRFDEKLEIAEPVNMYTLPSWGEVAESRRHESTMIRYSINLISVTCFRYYFISGVNIFLYEFWSGLGGKSWKKEGGREGEKLWIITVFFQITSL